MDQRNIKEELIFLLKHSSIYGFGTALIQAVSFLLLPLYTRFLTPSDYGVLSLIDTTTGIVGIVLGLGVTVGLARFYYDSDEVRYRNLVVSTAFWITGGFSVICSPLLILIAKPVSAILLKSAVDPYFILIALLALLFGLQLDLGLSYLRLRAQSKTFVKITLVRSVILISLNIVFVAILGKGVIGILYASLITKIGFCIYLTFPILRTTGLGFSRDLGIKMVRFSFPLIFSNLFRGIVNESDKYFVNYFFTAADTGIYSIAQKIGGSLHSLMTTPFLQAYLPRRFEIMKREDAREIYSKVFNYYLLGIGSVGLILAMMAPYVLRVMTTEEFYPAQDYVPLVILSIVIFGTKYHFETGIYIVKETKYISYINAVSALANIVLNYVLIREYRVWGALVALNTSYLITSVLTCIISYRLYRMKYDFSAAFRLLCLAVLAYLAVVVWPATNLFSDISIRIGVLGIFFALTFWSGVLGKDGDALVESRLGRLFALAKAKVIEKRPS